MTRTLGRLCNVSAFLASLCLIAIVVIILAQIVTRLMGTSIPSSDDFAAWAMAGAVFLALPSAFFNGSHIRVTLGIERMSETSRRLMLRLGNGVGFVLMTVLAGYTAWFVRDSFVIHDTSQGVLAVPMWIPQLSMLVGMLLCLPVLLQLTVSGQAACVEKDLTHDA